jgi:uncharacterized protein YjeT (DUF2065 family)
VDEQVPGSAIALLLIWEGLLPFLKFPAPRAGFLNAR